MKLEIPPTRTHAQLARWINASGLVYGATGAPVFARVEQWTSSTDRKISGTRLRHPGKGRRGLRLGVYVTSGCRQLEIYRHISSETYRRHEEAREWIASNLRHAAK